MCGSYVMQSQLLIEADIPTIETAFIITARFFYTRVRNSFVRLFNVPDNNLIEYINDRKRETYCDFDFIGGVRQAA